VLYYLFWEDKPTKKYTCLVHAVELPARPAAVSLPAQVEQPPAVEADALWQLPPAETDIDWFCPRIPVTAYNEAHDRHDTSGQDG
jgi:hypothetical protein